MIAVIWEMSILLVRAVCEIPSASYASKQASKLFWIRRFVRTLFPWINALAFISLRTHWTPAFKRGRRLFETCVYLLHALRIVESSVKNSWAAVSFDFSADSTAFNLKKMSYDFFLFCATVTSIVTSSQKAYTNRHTSPKRLVEARRLPGIGIPGRNTPGI